MRASGDVEAYADQSRWEESARKGMAMGFIQKLERGFATQLGSWFRGGKELSTGQWQKVALSRAFMRVSADVLILDEPTASMDAAAEAELFEYFREHTAGRMSILISHRFSTVPAATDSSDRPNRQRFGRPGLAERPLVSAALHCGKRVREAA